MSHCSALPFKLNFGFMLLASSKAKGYSKFFSGPRIELRGITSVMCLSGKHTGKCAWINQVASLYYGKGLPSCMKAGP